MSPRILLRALCALSLAACSPDSTATAPAPAVPLPATIVIADPGVIRDGDVVQLNAAVRSSTGATVPNSSVQWTVTDPAVATVSATGLLTALREGTTDVVAVAAGTAVQQRRSLAIVLHPATAIELDRTQLDLPIGQAGGIAATVRGLDGRVLLNRPLEWISSDPSVVTVSLNGIMTPRKVGVASITVRYGSLRATLQVRVPGSPTIDAYAVTSVNGQPVPGNVDEFVEVYPDSSSHRFITRIEGGTVTMNGFYAIELTLATYEISELGGNVILRLANRTTVRDVGELWYDLWNNNPVLRSTRFANLRHTVTLHDGAYSIEYREPGTDHRWNLGLTRRAP